MNQTTETTMKDTDSASLILVARPIGFRRNGENDFREKKSNRNWKPPMANQPTNNQEPQFVIRASSEYAVPVMEMMKHLFGVDDDTIQKFKDWRRRNNLD